MAWVDKSEWLPVGIKSLEGAADEVVRSHANNLVVAGPGAGKTELLAQRACYLLQTGACRPPKRIIAIAFKRDAAKNLGDRVKLRCGEKARRFDSLTLDAFAKSLVDRFQKAIPKNWRPLPNYEVRLRLSTDQMRDWLMRVPMPAGIERPNYHTWDKNDVKALFDLCSHGYLLPYDGSDVPRLHAELGRLWWQQQLAAPAGKPSLTFPMLNRLAAFMLRRNVALTRALRETYSFVFLDEFQDTTSAQYDLIRAAFESSGSIVTAVGDPKQRIMMWAGAMGEIFAVFEKHFVARRRDLVKNYRSAPELVRMQHAIAEAIEAGTLEAEPAKSEDVKGVCGILVFASPEEEAETIAGFIEKCMKDDGLKPRDFCVLVRQKTATMIPHLREALQRRQIRIRDESQLQDLLAEPVVSILLAVLRLATRKRDAEAWDKLTSGVIELYGGRQTESRVNWVEAESRRIIACARAELSTRVDCPQEMMERLAMKLLREIRETSLRSTYVQYARGSYLREVVQGLGEALAQAMEEVGGAKEAVDEVIGVDIIPAMTIHKSKGLEFHTIVFLGLEDSSWWAFASQSDEEKRSFFVAFSRAIQQVYFTFSRERDIGWGRKRQHRKQIGSLYSILERAGVQIYDMTGQGTTR